VWDQPIYFITGLLLGCSPKSAKKIGNIIYLTQKLIIIIPKFGLAGVITMSIRIKILLVILATTLILSGAIFSFSRIIIDNNYTNLEKDNVRQEVSRVISAYQTSLDHLNTLNHDWSAWDDTYNFVQTPNDDYIKVNPTDTTFINAKLNYIFIINKSGEIVYSKGFDLAQQQEVPVPENVQEQLTADKILAHENVTSSLTGILLLRENPLIFSSQPIITSEGKGPIEGTIIMARYLDEKVINSLQETVHLPVSITNTPDNDSPVELQNAFAALAGSDSIFVQPENGKTIAGYALIKDAYDKPALILKTELPRNIYAQGQSTLNRLTFISIMLNGLLIVTLILLINRLVISRLKSLSNNVNRIRANGNLADRVQAVGNDELSSLGFNINEMLTAIQTSQDLLQKKQHAEEQLRSTIESVADGLIVTDVRGTVLEVNEAAFKMFCYTQKSEAIGQNYRDLITKEDLHKAEETFNKTLEHGCSEIVEFTFVKKDGSYFPVELAAARLKDTSNQSAGIVFGIRDISLRRKMQKALRDKEEQYRLLVENQTDLIVEINTSGELRFMNPAYCKSIEKEHEHYLGSNIINDIHADDRETFLKAIESLDKETNTGSAELRMNLGKGCKWIAWTLNAVVDEQGNMAAITCIGRDVTEKNLAREELEKANAQLRELDKMKDNFLSTVSHELRTPLTSIKSFTEILLSYDEDKDTQKKFLGIISEESDRLTRLINDVLDLSKIQAGKMQWKNVEITIAEIINTVETTTRPLVQKAKLELITEVEPELPHILFDRDKLIQVFTNLLGNAIKFTREGGKVTVKAWTGQDIHKDNHQWITVSISDTGIGIAPENHHKIFENFGQVGDVLKDRPKGTGLGLPICKKIIENYGGRIWVESELGNGTNILFTLPVSQSAISTASIPQTLPIPPEVSRKRTLPSPGKTILVVDDEPNIRCFIQHELTLRGYRVIEAGGGNEAIDLARKYQPDLITLDICMPDLNGLDVTAVIKNDPEVKDIPILIISVMEEQQRAIKLGASDYLTKPINMEILMQRVNSLLGSCQKRILVVDDDEALAQSLDYELQKKGFIVQTVHSGKQALAYAENNSPDLILLDLKMPEMDGYEVIKVLKEKPETANIPVFIVTGIDLEGGKIEALSNGANDYFTKSGNFKTLFEAIEQILAGRIKPAEAGDIFPNKHLVTQVIHS
jgi:PAS domain S-box-containing protein